MRLLGLDFETTGFSIAEDRITEIGAVLWDTETKAPLELYSVFLYDNEIHNRFSPDTVAMMKRVSGITPEILMEFGNKPEDCLEYLNAFFHLTKADAVVAHNGNNYDKPLYLSEMKRRLPKLENEYLSSALWIDTKTDLPFEKDPESRKLNHLAMDHGFINPFKHRAVFDVLTMMKILSNYDINKVLELAKQATVVMRAMTSFDQKDLAKAQHYSWEKLGDKEYKKCWVKAIKEGQITNEIEICKNAGFQSVRIC